MAADGLTSSNEVGSAILESGGGRLSASEAAGTAAGTDCYSLPNTATTEQVLTDLGGYVITLWVVVGLVVLLLYGLLARTVWLVYRDERTPRLWRANIVWVNSVYPFVTLMCLGSLIVPASDALLNAVGVIYLSIAVSKFVDLCMLYFGGESQLLTSVGDINVPLASPPLCCCCRPCCPPRTITKRSLRVMKLLVYQLPFSQGGYFFFALYLYSARALEVGEVSGDPVSSLLTLLNAASFMLGMYGLSMLEATTQGQLTGRRYQAKFSLMKSTLVIIKLQEFIFDIAISGGGVSCTSSMSPKVYGAFIQNIVIAAEMPLFGLLSHWVYLADDKPRDDTDTKELHQGTTNTTTTAELQQSTTNTAELHQGITNSAELHQGNTNTAELHQGTTNTAELHQGTSNTAELHQSTTNTAELHQGTTDGSTDGQHSGQHGSHDTAGMSGARQAQQP